MNDSGAVKSATRVLDLLEMLAIAPDHVGVSDISRKLGIPKSSTHMLMTTLESRGYVIGDDDRRFRLNPLFHGEGRSWVGGTTGPLLRLGRLAVQRLADKTGESSFLGVATGGGTVEYVAKAVSGHDLRVDAALGIPRAMHATSIGQVLLAFQDPARTEAFLKSSRLARVTPHTNNDPLRLRRELKAIRERGFAVVRETNSLGAAGFAAPVFNGDSTVVAALSIAAPVARFESVLAPATQVLLREARDLSAELAGNSLQKGSKKRVER